MASDNSTNHILPLELYLKIGGTLLLLTIVTIWVAQYDLGAMNLLVAMLIATVKATLVGMYFMHLKYSNKLYAVILLGALTMVAVFIVFTMFDTMQRGNIYDIKARPIDDSAVIYRQAEPADTTIDTTAIVSDSTVVEVDSVQ